MPHQQYFPASNDEMKLQPKRLTQTRGLNPLDAMLEASKNHRFQLIMIITVPDKKITRPPRRVIRASDFGNLASYFSLSREQTSYFPYRYMGCRSGKVKQVKVGAVAQGQLPTAEATPEHRYSPNCRLIFHLQCEKFQWRSYEWFYP
jgi:hypothetical protein